MNIFQEKEIEKIAARNGLSKNNVVEIYHEACKAIKNKMNSVKMDKEELWDAETFPTIKLPYIGKIIVDAKRYKKATEVHKNKRKENGKI